MLEGSYISISCPHFAVQQRTKLIGQTTTSWSKGNTLAELGYPGKETKADGYAAEQWPDTGTQLGGGRTVDRQKQQQARERGGSSLTLNADLGHSRVKWFRNHVPLVNLNHPHYDGRCIGDNNNSSTATYQRDTLATEEDAQTTIKKAPELSQITELSTAAGGDNIEQRDVDWEPSLVKETDRSHPARQHVALDGPRVGPDFEIVRGENVNEQAAGRKFGASNLQPEDTEASRASRRRRSSSRSGCEPQWFVNESSGELIINKVATNFSGKYTCLALGKQSDVLLHVVGHGLHGTSSDSLIRRRRTFGVEADEAALASASSNHNEASTSGLANDDEPAKSFKLSSREETTGSRQSVTGSGLRIGTSAFPDLATTAAAAAIEVVADVSPALAGLGSDHKSGEEENQDSEAPRIGVLSSLDEKAALVQDVRLEDEPSPNQSATGERDRDKVQAFEWRTEWAKSDDGIPAAEIVDSSSWIRAPVQSVRVESVQVNELNSIPGFIYTKQRLHCPIWRYSAYFRKGFILTLARELCSSSPIATELADLAAAIAAAAAAANESAPQEQETHAHSRECRDLVASLLLQMDTLAGDNCDTSIMELAWFKDGKQLEFDGRTGKATATAAASAPSVRLINFCDQLDHASFSCDSSLQQKQSPSSGTSGTNGSARSSNKDDATPDEELNIGLGPARDGPILESRATMERRFDWICPSIGRTLEVDGVRQDSAGHFSCAFKLSILKLHRYIVDIRHRVHRHSQRQNKRRQRQHRQRESIPVQSHNISSCCTAEEGAETFSLPTRPGDASTSANETTTFQRLLSAQPEAFQAAHVAAVSDRVAPRRVEEASTLPTGNEWINLSKLIAKGLGGLGTNGAPSNGTDRSRVQLKDPMAIIQTFHLTVMERQGKFFH